MYTGNDVIQSHKVSTRRSIQSALNIHRQSVRDPTVSTPIFPSTATEVKCSKNEDDNAHFRIREESRDIPLQNYQQTKTTSRKRRKRQDITQRNNSILQSIPEIAERCERSVLKCKKTLAMMNELLRTSRMENFWLRWNLQEMGPRISQSEYNATFMPTSVRARPFSRVAAAACAPKPRVFTPKSGNVKSTTLSTATARSRSSPPTCAHTPGLTSCQAS